MSVTMRAVSQPAAKSAKIVIVYHGQIPVVAHHQTRSASKMNGARLFMCCRSAPTAAATLPHSATAWAPPHLWRRYRTQTTDAMGDTCATFSSS